MKRQLNAGLNQCFYSFFSKGFYCMKAVKPTLSGRKTQLPTLLWIRKSSAGVLELEKVINVVGCLLLEALLYMYHLQMNPELNWK